MKGLDAVSDKQMSKHFLDYYAWHLASSAAVPSGLVGKVSYRLIDPIVMKERGDEQ